VTRPDRATTSAALLLVATAAALLWANSPWQHGYHDLWHRDLVGLDLHAWINEGLMSVFFFVVAAEVRHEVRHGELRDRRHAALPVAAAIGGMVVPALLYLVLNLGGDGQDGWAIPVATDIAFAMGVLALVAPRIPTNLRLFLLTLAVVDDIGAILVIAVVYSSGIHATIVGVVLGLVVVVPRRLEAWLRRVSTLVIVPVFALANAGVTFTSAGIGDAASSAVTWGIVVGLVLGKPLGIVGGAWLAQRARLARLPDGVGWRQLAGVAAFGGIGFTVSIFITGLAFDAPATIDEAKVAILVATVLAAGLGALLLRGVSDGRDETASART
jgi:NhaA family Na+:H+ antiporter